jgi:hypothetical protein
MRQHISSVSLLVREYSEFVLLPEDVMAPDIEELGLDRLSAEDRLAVAEAI